MEPDWVEPYYARCGMTMGPLVCGCPSPVKGERTITHPWTGNIYPACDNCGHPIEPIQPTEATR
jgi:hypothetical protein